MGGTGDLLSLMLNVPPWKDPHELSPQELHLTGLVTTDAIADVLPERRVSDPALAAVTPKSVQDRLGSSADDGKIPLAPKSTKTAEAALPAGGVATVVPAPKWHSGRSTSYCVPRYHPVPQSGAASGMRRNVLHDGVAFVRRLFQPRAVENLHGPPAVIDEAGALHRLRRKRHGFPVGAQDVREKLMSIWERFTTGAIVHHQDATGTSAPPSCAVNCMRPDPFGSPQPGDRHVPVHFHCGLLLTARGGVARALDPRASAVLPDIQHQMINALLVGLN